MKRFITTIVCLLLLAGNVWAIASIIVNRGKGVLQRSNPVVLDPYLAHYFLNGNSPAEDSSGNALNLTLGTGTAAPYWVSRTNSITSYYELGSGDSLSNYPFSKGGTTNQGTVSFWVKSVSDTGAYTIPVGWYDRNESISNRLWFGLRYVDDAYGDDSLDITCDVNGTAQWRVRSDEQLLDSYVGCWAHLCVVKSSDTNVALYWNGSAISKTWTATGTQTAWLPQIYAASPLAANTFKVGSSGQNYTGGVAYVVAQTSILSAADVSALTWASWTNFGMAEYDYNNRGQWSNSVALWSMNYDGVAADTGSSTLQFVSKGAGAAAPTHSTVSKNNGCYFFDGGDNITIASTAFNFAQSFTATVWINPTTVSAGIMKILQNAGASEYWFVALNSANIQLRILDDISGDKQVKTGTIATGVWQHVAMVASRGSTLSLYINGQYIAQNATLGNYNTQGGTMCIGWSGSGQNFQGYIDEGRVYNYAFTSNEVNTLYTDTKGYFGL